MKRRIVVGGIMALAFVAGCGANSSQERVVVTSPRPVVVHREPVREVIVVERTHVPKGNAHGWWKKHGYREVTVYYDGTRYYSRRLEPTGFRAVVVYQREGKYYLAEEGAEHDRSHHDKDAERHRSHHDDDQGEDD
jgi:hypothetical protein